MNSLNLFRRASMLGLIAGTLVLAFAAPSFAGGGSNPDVRDINTTLDATSGTKVLDTNRVQFRTGQSTSYYYYGGAQNYNTPGSYLKGFASGYDGDAGVGVQLLWFAFEPDSVKRTDTGASIRQKSNIALGVYLTGNSSGSEAGLVEGCSAKGKIKLGSTDKASASLKCPKSVWEDLGFNEVQIETLQSLSKGFKIKFGYKGSNEAR